MKVEQLYGSEPFGRISSGDGVVATESAIDLLQAGARPHPFPFLRRRRPGGGNLIRAYRNCAGRMRPDAPTHSVPLLEPAANSPG